MFSFFKLFTLKYMYIFFIQFLLHASPCIQYTYYIFLVTKKNPILISIKYIYGIQIAVLYNV